MDRRWTLFGHQVGYMSCQNITQVELKWKQGGTPTLTFPLKIEILIARFLEILSEIQILHAHLSPSTILDSAPIWPSRLYWVHTLEIYTS